MSNITKTYSGDFSSFIAGKLLNAAGMAKGEKERRETENLEKARPGSLFVKALQSEFGGDLYNRTLGNFDPRKSAGETDRKSSREKRYQAQFGELKKTPKSDLDDAEKELLKDDDSIPVKDVESRENISKILGVGLHTKVLLADARVTGLSNDVGAINDNLVNTQKLIYDQNEMIGSKFDQILEIYSGQKDYQKKIADKAEVQRRETELEAEKDLSATRKLQSTVATKKGPDILGSILGVAADMLRGKKGSKIFSSLLNALKNTKSKTDKVRALANVARLLIGARRDTIRGRAAFNFGKGLYDRLRTDTLEEAIGLSKPRTRTEKLKEIATNKPARSPINLDVKGPVRKWNASSMMMQSTTLAMISPLDKEILSAALDVDVDNLPNELSKPGVSEKLKKAAAEGIIDPSDIPRLQKNADTLAKSVKPPSSATSRRMATEVTEKLGTTGGAQLLESAGKKGSSKILGKAGKFVPGLGTGVSLAEAGYRFSQGDITGGILSLGSAIPILGWGFTAIDIARDLGYNPMGLPEAPQYERGTNLTKPGMSILHGTELRVTSKDREDMLGSYKDAINQIGSTLVSSAVSLGDASGFGQEVKSELKKSGLNYDIVNIPLSTSIGKGGATPLSESLVSDLRPDIPGVSGGSNSDTKNTKDGKNKPNSFKRRPTRTPEQIPVDPNLTIPEYDLDYNEPNSAIKMTGADKVRYYRTDGNGQVIWDEITEAEARRSITAKIRYNSNPGVPDPDAGGPVIQFWPTQGPDKTGEPGVDFSFADYKSNYAVFPGEVIEMGQLYGAAYGNVVIVRSVDPSNGKEFDALYAHFPNGGIAVSNGQQVNAGEYLGKVGWDEANGRSAPGAGSMDGWHTSLDFYEPGSTAPYSNAAGLVNMVVNGANKNVRDLFFKSSATELRNAEEIGPVIPPENGSGGPSSPSYGKGGYRPLSLAKDGAAIQRVGNDREFLRELTRISKKFNIREGDLLGLIASESSLDPQSNNGEYVGLIQFSKDSAKMVGTTQAALLQMTRAEQMKYVEKYLEWWGLPRGADAGQLYSVVFAPALASGDPNTVMYRQGSGAYKANRWLDTNQDGVITVSELGGRIQRKKGEYGISDLAGPKIVGPGKVGPGKVGSGIPFFPDLTIKKIIDAIKKGVNDGLDRGKQRERNEELLKLLPMLDNRPDNLRSSSQLMEDMEEQVIQQVYVVNNVVASSPPPPIITSSGRSSTDYVDQYRMAVLGA